MPGSRKIMDLESWVTKMGRRERWVQKDGRGVKRLVGNAYCTQKEHFLGRKRSL